MNCIRKHCGGREKMSNTNGGIGFTGLLTILFIGLKLSGKIDWSWWWVLSPIWIILIIGIIIIIMMIIVAAIND